MIKKTDNESFSVQMGYDPAWLDKALEIYNLTELKRSNSERVHDAFSKSQVVVTVWSGARLVGVGRAISDFRMYSAIFDVVVEPTFQKSGVGKIIMTSLLESLNGTFIFLTSTFGNEQFYKKLGFRFHKSAMALYPERVKNSPYIFKSYTLPVELMQHESFNFRLAKIEDSSDCFLLNEQLGYKTQSEEFQKRFQFLIGHSEHELFVVVNPTGTIIAWMHLCLRHLLEDDHFVQIAAVVVDEKLRNNGIGAKLLLVAENWARFQDMKQVRLHSSLPREKAHKFYLKNGYIHLKSSKLFIKELL